MLPIANIFQPLIDVFESVMVFFHDNVGFSWGFSIIALTIVVRAALVPLTYKQIKSMRAMQLVAPQIKALQEKYRDDKQRLQQETMKFYQENKINPFASCLPLLLQMPVFISLFYMLRKDLRYDICPDINPPTVSPPKPCGSTPESQFLFIPDITNKATGGVLIALIVLYVGTQLVSSLFMTTTADRNQRLLMLGLPFFFVPFVINFPAGLLVYWITTNLWTVGQGLVMRRIAPPPPRPVPGMAITGGGGGGGGSGGGGSGKGSPPPAKPTPAEPSSRRGARRGSNGDEAGDGASGRPRSAPPPPPRRKKKRSGRRR